MCKIHLVIKVVLEVILDLVTLVIYIYSENKKFVKSQYKIYMVDKVKLSD
ncbi:hypothetical protein CaldiYA01_22480 [Caldicellulosiruptor diazotrophicus]|uniref:Uncharacterized protein n=1 Tax=Caldicellulosiruptor diazotrophicus TaxID=2806205 RepID=A0ABM7NQC3_9FIRM|nr:hypothetical protein CaldiYA01_22480 [Caldicellulosiruptor diazotrophicus]